MRTSNKILLGAFVATVFILTGIHVTLSAKAKNGELVVFHSDEPQEMERHPVGNIKYVVIRGMEECRIVQGDTASLEMHKNWKNHFTYTVSADTLTIAANEQSRGARVYMPVDLYLPKVESIVAINSRLYVRGVDDSSAAASRTIKLFSGQLYLTAATREARVAYWDSLNISCTGGHINIPFNAVISDMSAMIVANSMMMDEGAKFGSFSLKMDSTSSASLRAGSLDKLKYNKP